MKTKTYTYHASARDRAIAEFFENQTSVPVEVLTNEGESQAGLRVGDRVLSSTELVCPVELRERLAAAGVAFPEHRIVENVSDVETAFSGNQPVTVRAGQESQYAQFATDGVLPYQRIMASQPGARAVVETPCEGTGHWVFGLVTNGEVRVCAVADLEWKDEARRFPIAVSLPTSRSQEQSSDLQDVARKVVASLDFDSGPFRVECVFGDDGIRVTEVDLGRFGGGLPVDLLQLAGIADYWAEQCVLLDIDAQDRPLESRPVALRWLRSRSGIVESVDGASDVLAMNGVLSLQVDVKPGNQLGHVLDRYSRDRLGYLVVSGESNASALTMSNYAVESLVVHRRTVI